MQLESHDLNSLRKLDRDMEKLLICTMKST